MLAARVAVLQEECAAFHAAAAAEADAAAAAAAAASHPPSDGEDDDDNTCAICYDRPIGSVFEPCGVRVFGAAAGRASGHREARDRGNNG